MIKLLKWVGSLGVIGGTFLLAYYLFNRAMSPEHMVPRDYPAVGVIQVIEHPALDQTREGILDELKEAGFVNGETMNWIFESAQGNATLATQIAQKLVGQEAKLLITIGTTPSQAAAQVTSKNSNIPIVFASVTDPIGAKLVANPDKPEANITGVSNYIEVEKQFKVFLKILPTLKRLGIIYNPGEANSVILLEKMQVAAKEFDIELVLVTASKTSEVSVAAQSLVGKVDAIFINNDNTALAAFESVAKVGKENSLAVFVSDQDCLKKGALAAVGPDQYVLGRQVGKMVARLLRGQMLVKDIPVILSAKPEVKVNLKVAYALGLHSLKQLVNSSELDAN